LRKFPNEAVGVREGRRVAYLFQGTASVCLALAIVEGGGRGGGIGLRSANSTLALRRGQEKYG